MADVPTMDEIMQPKWVLATKRGWGMTITGLTSLLPLLDTWVSMKWGVHISAPVVDLVGQAGTHVLDAIGMAVGVVLWVWGSFRPTAPLTLFRRP